MGDLREDQSCRKKIKCRTIFGSKTGKESKIAKTLERLRSCGSKMYSELLCTRLTISSVG